MTTEIYGSVIYIVNDLSSVDIGVLLQQTVSGKEN